MILFHLFFLCARPFGQKSGSILIYFLYLCTTIRPKIRVLINLFLIFAHDHSTEIYDHLSLILSFCPTIRPKIRVLINFFCLFVQDHSASQYFVQDIHCGSYISYAIFMAIWSLRPRAANFHKFSIIFWEKDVSQLQNKQKSAAATQWMDITDQEITPVLLCLSFFYYQVNLKSINFLKARVRYFLSKLYFFTRWKPFKSYEKCFYFV